MIKQMKQYFTIIGLVGLSCLSLLSVPILAEGVGDDNSTQVVCNEYICLPEESSTENTKENKMDEGLTIFTQPLRTTDDKIYEEVEKDKMYMKFVIDTLFGVPNYNASWTVVSVNGAMMSIVWFLTIVIQLIGSLPVYLLMLVANFSTNGFLRDAILGMASWVNNTLFDWESPESFGMKLIVIVGVLTFVTQLLKHYKNIHFKQIGMLFVRVFLSALILGFLAPKTIEISVWADNMVYSFISQADVMYDEPAVTEDIRTKEYLYNLLALQPYMIQNFEVGSDEALAEKLKALGIDKSPEEFTASILLCSKDSDQKGCLEKIYPNIGTDGLLTILNSEKIFSGATVTHILKVFTMAIHRVMLSIPFFILYFFKDVFEMIKWLSLIFGFFSLISMLFRQSGYMMFFINRISWTMMSYFMSLAFSIRSMFMMMLTGYLVDNFSSLSILVLDIIFMGMFAILWLHRKELSKYILKLLSITSTFMARAIMSPNYSPVVAGGEMKATFEKLDAVLENMQAKIDKMVVDTPPETKPKSTATGKGTSDNKKYAPHHDKGDTPDSKITEEDGKADDKKTGKNIKEEGELTDKKDDILDDAFLEKLDNKKGITSPQGADMKSNIEDRKTGNQHTRDVDEKADSRQAMIDPQDLGDKPIKNEEDDV